MGIPRVDSVGVGEGEVHPPGGLRIDVTPMRLSLASVFFCIGKLWGCQDCVF
jgi:hypothetical protein